MMFDCQLGCKVEPCTVMEGSQSSIWTHYTFIIQLWAESKWLTVYMVQTLSFASLFHLHCSATNISSLSDPNDCLFYSFVIWKSPRTPVSFLQLFGCSFPVHTPSFIRVFVDVVIQAPDLNKTTSAVLSGLTLSCGQSLLTVEKRLVLPTRFALYILLCLISFLYPSLQLGIHTPDKVLQLLN